MLLPKPLATLFLLLIGIVPLMAQDSDQTLESVRNYTPISDNLASAGQITSAHIQTLKDEGFEVVINLAPASPEHNAEEGFLVVQQGMSYIHIPVSWQEPSPRDLQLFFDVMKANTDRKVFVHCFANMRASAFVYLYRTLYQNVSEEEALATMHQVWDPMELEQWATLITDTQAAAR